MLLSEFGGRRTPAAPNGKYSVRGMCVCASVWLVCGGVFAAPLTNPDLIVSACPESWDGVGSE